MNTQASVQHSHISARKVKRIKNFDCAGYEALPKIGINIEKIVNATLKSMAMDAIQPTVTTGSITTPVQFLQNWLPGFVNVITAARKIDDLVGISTIGAWCDEQIVQGILELVGRSVLYGDYTNTPMSSWNANYNTRTVVRFEEGMMIGILEEERAGRVNIDSGSSKRSAAALALEIQRNAVGFLGFNGGDNNTYGFLNDPGLGSYVSVSTGVSSSTHWSTKTFLEITGDIRTAVVALRLQSEDNIDPEAVNMTLALPTAVVDYLTTVSDFGISVRDWMTKTYPRIRVVSAPELDGANGGANVMYLYADSINDMSTDDSRTFIQVVPAKFMVTGVQQVVKGYLEGYTNATAGVMCKRPWAVVRFTGL